MKPKWVDLQTDTFSGVIRTSQIVSVEVDEGALTITTRCKMFTETRSANSSNSTRRLLINECDAGYLDICNMVREGT